MTTLDTLSVSRTLLESVVPTPVGDITILCDGGEVVAAAFSDRFARVRAHLDRRCPGWVTRPAMTAAVQALTDYLDGELDALASVSVRADGSAFQQDIWAALRRIPPGTTWDYATLAEAAGHPGAARAAGTANGANPVSLFVPCHRVVPATGGVGGYAGGPARKAWLLKHEGIGPF